MQLPSLGDMQGLLSVWTSLALAALWAGRLQPCVEGQDANAELWVSVARGRLVTKEELGNQEASLAFLCVGGREARTVTRF